MKLYEIIKEIDAFEFEFDENGEVINIEELESLEIEKDKKIENIALAIKNIKAEAEAVKAEKQALADRQKALENKAENFQKFLASILGGEKFSTPKVAISYRKSESVQVVDETIISPEWLKITTSLDKAGIKTAIKAGATVEGATIEVKNNIVIK